MVIILIRKTERADSAGIGKVDSWLKQQGLTPRTAVSFFKADATREVMGTSSV